MKIRTAIISVIVTGSLVGGVVYGAYYTMSGRKSPVDVIPVSYVNYSWMNEEYFYDESMEGTVTSQISQTVELDSEYPIDEIYVSEGDEVTEGTPLFSYDMTKQEIELEADEIELLSNQLQLRRKQKELEQYQGTGATANLETTATVLTSSSAEASSEDTSAGAQDAGADSGNGAAGTDSSAAASDGTEDSESSAITSNDAIVDSSSDNENTSEPAGGDSGSSGDDLEIEGVEVVEDAGADSSASSDSDSSEDEVYRNAVTNFETLMTVLQSYIDFCGDEFDEEDVDLIKESLLGDEEDSGKPGAVSFYRENLADTPEDETITDTLGETVTAKKYELKSEVTDALTADERKALEACVSLMETYHAKLIDLLIDEAASETDDAQKEAAEEARAAYEDLSSDAMVQVTQLAVLEELEAQLWPEDETESESETGSGSETETSQPDSETETSRPDSETETSQPDSEADSSESETEPEDMDVASRISTFLVMAESVLSETASPSAADYQNVIAFYQMYLGVAQADIEGADSFMESYELSDAVLEYLNAQDSAGAAVQVQLETDYREVCLAYVRYMVLSLDAQTMTREELTAAQEAYDQLGTAWQLLLGTEEPAAADYLAAYDIILRIQELDAESESFLTDLSALYTDYLALSSTQMALVWNADVLFELLEQYGLLQEETETEYESESESEFYWDDDDYDYYWDDDDSLTAEELAELIESLESEIKELELDIRENELNIAQEQRVVDGKVVTSTLDGTVVSIGDEDGNSDDEYFVKVTNTTGLYVIGTISELSLDTVNVGDVISGTTYSGDSFTAVIKEISDYPDSSDSYYYSGNSNSSYYTFYALIDDPEGIEEDGCELTLSDAYVSSGDSIWLEAYFVRTDSTGSNYVYIQGDDGTLKQQYVTTGRSLYDYYIEVTGGLETSDLITFPYGDDVYEGAKTNEVDSVDEAAWYGY